jgi:Fe-S oxidoreductase
MNITVVEPERTREKSTCCGDTFFGTLPVEEVLSQMKAKADTMPLDDVIVYCVSCSKSMFNGGKHPRYLIDVLFGEETVPKTFDPVLWHKELDDFIAAHNESSQQQHAADGASRRR